jgi:hypothetical protein
MMRYKRRPFGHVAHFFDGDALARIARPRDELRNNVFGKLRVVSCLTTLTCLCQCQCGSYKITRRADLTRGHVKTCGKSACRVRKDLTSVRFGRLTVLGLTERVEDNRHKVWSARCDCGNEILVRAKSLVSGNTRSCGCLRQDVSRNTVARQPRAKCGRLMERAA